MTCWLIKDSLSHGKHLDRIKSSGNNNNAVVKTGFAIAEKLVAASVV